MARGALASLVALCLLGSSSSVSSSYTLNDGTGRTSDGNILYMWGRNNVAQLGVVSCVQDTRFFTFSCLPDTVDRSTPSACPLLGYSKVLNASLGNTVSFVLLADGSVYSWGEGQYLGVETSELYTGVPNLVDGLAGTRRIEVGYTSTLASFAPRQGNIIEYDDFQNFHSDFSFVGDAQPSFSPPLDCPRCVAWEKSKAQPVGFAPITGYKCQAPLWGTLSNPWCASHKCYVGSFASAPCKNAIQAGPVPGEPGMFYFLTECVDNGRVHLTPYPPEPNKRGCLWYNRPVEVFSAFTSTFRFEIEGSELDATHGGGDGIAFVMQNEGPTALGGSGNV
ncbi:hypothetical protein GUITHDRAFT_148917 [Guillardia theta CCMP2712]|uniref:Uncharacterized protein n=1 Tax=Guillardia theta (strain CCMP2712) TaxID=905079 RepID=L1I7Z5_GUITC|nr:hypothetical protein GUITHDRAFT_148917 [Guillardia theta CCMP2712]EKX32024.1 hypothetical protein GUITHDRAFT_148917 [Guillardia theta CCMP2712]|eukprot:XP_005819004.1 hypothetical protein GUITHDRAFT_148917 [Guillardia theta CCMP2712]